MGIEVTVRHVAVPQALRQHASERAAETLKKFSHLEHIHVILDQQRHCHIAEVIVQGKRSLRFEASESGDNMGKAINGAMEKIERHLQKTEEKMMERNR